MIRTLKPEEAIQLIQAGEVDVVDVRGEGEWSRGHIAEARLVPLDRLTADPRASLPRDNVIFVCAKGVRSLKAAQAAEAAGLTHLYSIEGGTNGWCGAGLPLIADGAGI